MPLITLTGPPKFASEAGSEIQMAIHPDHRSTDYRLEDDSRWVRKANGSIGIPDGVHYSRPEFRLVYSGLTNAEASPLITLLQDSELILFTPRTQAAGETDPEVTLTCRITDPVRITEHIKRGRVVLSVGMVSLDTVRSVPAVLSSIRVSLPNQSKTTSNFLGSFDLGQYPVCTDLWNNLDSTGANLRVRDAAGNEVSFQIMENWNYDNRSGTINFRTTLSDTETSFVDIVAVDMLIPSAPRADDANGSQQVFTSNKWAWNLDGLAATDGDFPDSSPNGVDLTPTAMDDANRVYGPSSYAQGFNGADEYGVTADFDNFPEGYFCVEAWAYIPSGASDVVVLGICGANDDNAGSAALFELSREENDKWRFAVGRDDNTAVSIVSTATIDDDQWVHLFAVYYPIDGTNVVLRLYVDASQAAVDEVYSGTRAAPSNEFVIGARYFNDNITSFMDGMVGQVVIYDSLPSSVNSLDTWVARRFDQWNGLNVWDAVALSQDGTPEGFSDYPLTNLYPAVANEAVQFMGFGRIGDELILVGGYNGSTQVTTVQKYDVRENVWRSDTAVTTAMEGPAMGVLNGELHIVGGYNGSTETNINYVRDSDTGLWGTAAVYPASINGPASAVLDGELWVICGFENGVGESTRVEIYNPATDAWTAGPAFPVVRFSPVAIAANDTIYVIGGFGAGSARQTAHKLNAARDGWVAIANYPTVIWRARGYAFRNRPFVSGGNTTDAATVVTEVYSYDELTDTWNEEYDLPSGLAAQAVAVIDDTFAIDTCGDTGSSQTDETTVYSESEQDACLNSEEVRSIVETPIEWAETGGATDYLPEAIPGIARRAIAAGTIGGRIVFVGGQDASVYVPDCAIFDPHQNEWSTGADYVDDVSAATYGVYNGELYLFGGFNGTSWLQDVYSYAPDRNSWIGKTQMPNADVGPVGAWYNGRFYKLRGSTAELDIYDAADNSWSTGATGTNAHLVGAAIAYNDYIYFVGRTSPGSNLVDRYDPEADSWTAMNNFPINEISGRMFVYGDEMYIYVGDDNALAPALGTIYVYDEGADSWSVAGAGASPTPVIIPGLAVMGDRIHVVGGDTLAAHVTTHQMYSFIEGWL